MFIKPFNKYCKTTKTRYSIYSLCESYRDGSRTLHRSIICLGKLDELPTVEEKKLLGSRIEEMIKNGGNTLALNTVSLKIEELAQHYYREVIKKRRYDLKHINSLEQETVYINTLKNKDAREIGAEWLCLQALGQLGLSDFLKSKQWSEEKINLAQTHIISRAVYPASELKTVSWLKDNSSVCELTGFDKNRITKDLLYGISKRLFKLKEPLEQFLSKQTNELFDLQDTIILYDLTNTYFEGQMKESEIARFGRSKEKRSDAKLIVLAIVVNQEGFLKYSNIFEGNTSDSSTLKRIIDKLSSQTSVQNRKPIVVMDAGIATEDNIKLLRAKGYDYLCVSRSSLKAYEADISCTPVMIKDRKLQPIELMKVRVENDNDHYLWVRSHAKALKERSMNRLFAERFEQGLEQIKVGVSRKGGTKKLEKVWERIGRLKEKYPSIHKHYDIKVAHKNEIVSQIEWELNEYTELNNKAGIYFLRTSLDEQDEQTLWTIYNTIREIEYTFRVLKTDLDLRPIYHKTDEAAMAHLHLGILAYWVVNTIRYQLKQKGIHSDWREIVRIMNTQKCVTTSVENIKQETISIRQCTEPNQSVKQIYQALKYKLVPFVRKKSVVLPSVIFKKSNNEPPLVMDG